MLEGTRTFVRARVMAYAFAQREGLALA